ncbi:autism susceptibility gene 2 protein isoform X2 [Centruroides vittatus]|uniref:autism susceptibility gene 2 protein isoform X2 n=1 Tax=Centruroides vittatus TaxID=120091 RepID=UPI003510AF37
MDSDTKQRNQRTRRRVKMQKGRDRSDLGSGEDGDESPGRHKSQRPPPTRKKRCKEPLFEEDVIDGFAILSFKTYEDLESTLFENNRTSPEPMFNCQPKCEEKITKKKTCNLAKVNNNNKRTLTPNKITDLLHNNTSVAELSNEENSRPNEELTRPQRCTSGDQLSDVSSHTSSERGYLCDSESDSDRGTIVLPISLAIKKTPLAFRPSVTSDCLDVVKGTIRPQGTDAELDVFETTAHKNFSANNSSCDSPAFQSNQNSRSSPPPLLSSLHPSLNGPLHPEPSAAVAAVTATISVANPVAATAIPTATSPREPLVCSPPPPVSVASSNSGGILQHSPPFFLPSHKGDHSVNSANRENRQHHPPSRVFNHPPVVNNKLTSRTHDHFLSNHTTVPLLSNCLNHTPTTVTVNSTPKPPTICINSGKTTTITGTEVPSLYTLPHPTTQQQYTQRSPSPSIPSAVVVTSSVTPSSSVTPVSTRVSVTITTTTPLGHRSASPLVVTTPHPNTPTPNLGRDSHSAHSNSSLSSLSQLSQSFHNSNKEGTSGRSRSSSRNNTPSISVASTSCCTYSAATLTSLVFSKPHSWVSSGTSSILATANGPHPTPPLPPRPTPPSPNPSALSLPPSLHNSHHSSPFSAHPTSLHPGAAHSGMFAPPIPPPGSLTTSSLSLGGSAGPSPFTGDSLFAQPNQDLLRRELDTRFLASQDRTINIPPPPYLRSEMHQHQHHHHHSNLHQHGPFLPPPLGGSLVPQATTHLYDKFAKLDSSSFYSRNALGLAGYPGLSPLLAPSGAAAATTPFAPPGHLAAFQPKMNSLVKSKTMKSGKWCAMHVRIAWEIYHHQQKQQAEAHKASGAPNAAAAAAAAAAAKATTDLLRPPNHLFSSLPRPHDLSTFSPSLLGATGVPPFARPGYHGFGAAGSSFGGLGALSLAGTSMFGNRDLSASSLAGLSSAAQDPWSRLHRAPPTFPTPVAPGSTAPWGGLKAEAERERERMQREEQEREKEREREKQRKGEMDKERREKDSDKIKDIGRDKREQERQKERDRENRVIHHHHHHHVTNSESIRNGDLVDRGREREKEWEKSRERRETSRSPIRSSREPLPGSLKNGSAFESSSIAPTKQEIKVKEERKEEDNTSNSNSRDSAVSAISSVPSERDRTRPSDTPQSEATVAPADFSTRTTVPPHSSTLGLNSLDRTHVMGPLGLGPDRPPHSQVPHYWGPFNPATTSAAIASSGSELRDHFRNLDFLQSREIERERELMQRYIATTRSSMMALPTHERFRDVEFSRQMSSVSVSNNDPSVRDLERQRQLDRERQAVAFDRAKLLPPPLRPTDPPYGHGPGIPSVTVASSIFPSLATSNPYLNSLCASSSNPGNTKSKSGTTPGNGIPPPLIPCSVPVSVGSGGGTVVVQNHTGQHSRGSSPLLHKLGAGSGTILENSHEPFHTKDRRELPAELNSQSR